MKYEGKDLYLLIWDGNKGKHNKFILNPALNQNTDGEFHAVLGMKFGEL